MIDTHAHIYLEEFDEDRKDIIEDCVQKGIHHIFMPNIDVNSIHQVHQVESDFPQHCIAMMGLHPCYVKEDFDEQLSIIEQWLNKRSYAAIGEIGIDLYWDKTTLKLQEIAFRRQIEWAIEKELPIVIHSRDSLDLTISIVEEMNNEKLSGVFHCFNGTLEQAKRIEKCGFFMGIGGVATFKKAGVDKTVAQIPLQSLVLETDAPYLSPTPYRGKRNTPQYLPIIADKIAEVQDITLQEVVNQTDINAKKLFSNHFQKHEYDN